MKAKRFLDQVREIHSYCVAEAKCAQQGVDKEWGLWLLKYPTPDFRPLNDLVYQLTLRMSKAEEYCKEIEGCAPTWVIFVLKKQNFASTARKRMQATEKGQQWCSGVEHQL